MALNTTTSKIDGFVVVYLSGAIFFGEESTSLRILGKDLLNRSRQIVLDLGGITHIDSDGLGTLAALYMSAREVGSDIKLAKLSSHAHEVLQITKLVRVFEVFDKGEDAIASFIRAAAAT